jgi:hypothetical protein
MSYNKILFDLITFDLHDPSLGVKVPGLTLFVGPAKKRRKK